MVERTQLNEVVIVVSYWQFSERLSITIHYFYGLFFGWGRGGACYLNGLGLNISPDLGTTKNLQQLYSAYTSSNMDWHLQFVFSFCLLLQDEMIRKKRDYKKRKHKVSSEKPRQNSTSLSSSARPESQHVPSLRPSEDDFSIVSVSSQPISSPSFLNWKQLRLTTF